MAGDMRVAKYGADLEAGDYLFVGSAERAFPITEIRSALTMPGCLLVTVETSASTTWTVTVDGDEPCSIEVLS